MKSVTRWMSDDGDCVSSDKYKVIDYERKVKARRELHSAMIGVKFNDIDKLIEFLQDNRVIVTQLASKYSEITPF